MLLFQALMGIVVFVGIGYAFSLNRKAIPWKTVGLGLAAQLLLGILLIKVPGVSDAFGWLSTGLVTFLSFTDVGMNFLVGELNTDSFGFIFAFRVLPIIIFFSAVTSALYYLGILQWLVKGIAWLMTRTLRISGSESLSMAGNIFLGQTEAPLLVKPFIAGMTRSELACLMIGGMATVAGSVLVGYVTFLGGDDPQQQALFAKYLLSASIMNAPAAIVMSKLLVPELHPENVDQSLHVAKEEQGANLLDSITRGASQGLRLAANVGAMLMVFIALIAAVNYLLKDQLGELTGLNAWITSSTSGTFDGLTMEYILGQIFRPLAWLMGLPWEDTLTMGSLIGQKTVINEFVAYLNLSELKNSESLSPRTLVVATYALCGFSNFSSIAIQIGGIGGMAPSQQSTLARLGLRALLGASLACVLTGTLAGVLVFL